ncbi:cell wall anchor protein, partial [[Ruminococcus] gnavus]|nr:cell wall anchor protein [Mediterraneibacter gnavus]
MKRSKVWMLASILALGGMSVSTVGAPLLTVQAAEEVVAAKEYTTQGGIANMGSGTANITIKGNEGQTLVGKKFHVYKLFLAQNAQGMESINYTFNPTYEQALKNVAAKALSVPVDEVTEYMVIDYIQSLNSYKVEGAQTEQELEGRYSK